MKTTYIKDAHYLDYFFHWEKKKHNQIYLQQPLNGKWQALTYRQAGQVMRKIAAYLVSIGIKKGDHIGIVSKNTSEWILADLAICTINAVSVPYYPNLNGEALGSLIKESDLSAIFIGKINTWDSIKEAIPLDLPIITMLDYPENSLIDRGKKWEDILREFEPYDLAEYTKNPDDIWTIIFTSGTTGSPKGAVLTNQNVISLLDSETKHNMFGLAKFYSFKTLSLFTVLPLNHIAERVCGEIFSLIYGGKNSFPESIDSFLRDIQYARPNILFSVPHLWSKFQMGILYTIPQEKLNRLLSIPIVSFLVKKRIKKKLGFDKLALAVTAAAPISKELKQWYLKLGIELREAYGMTEVSGPTVVMPYGDSTLGVVGKVIEGMYLKIDSETKEILISGPLVMKEYYKNPELTSKVITDGWMHTGDTGKIDEKGYLHLEGRKSDTFKTAKGKFLAPMAIESLMDNDENIEMLIIIGIGVPQPMALIRLSEVGITKSEDQLKIELVELLGTVNSKLLNYQRLSKIIIVEDDWNMDNKMLTPTLKIRRNEIDDKYRKKYLKWFEQPEIVIWEKAIEH